MDVKAGMFNCRSIVFAAMMPTVAAVALVLAVGVLFAQQNGKTDSERIPLAVVTWALSAMATAVVACAGGCWWLIRQYIAAVKQSREREECLMQEAREAEAKYAQEISDTIREVMPLTIKLTDFIPTQQKLTQAIMELAQALGRKQDGEARQS